MQPIKIVVALAAVAAAATGGLITLAGCGGGGDTAPAVPASIEEAFKTSLHGTRRGMETWYAAANQGFELLTGLSYASLPCGGCHPGTLADGTPINPATYRPSCSDCHVKPGDQVADAICLKCHRRQKAEMSYYSDIHRQEGFRCVDCHTAREMHGDGRPYTSWLEPGATETRCEKCHIGRATIPAHDIHRNTVHCTACHTRSVISCYNCHFETLAQGKFERLYKQFRDWTLLVRRQEDNKVYAGTVMSLTYGGKSFVALAPYRAHTITATAKKCEECHANEAVKEYFATGKIEAVRWDGTQLVNKKGVVPVPPDWRQTMRFGFVDYTGDPLSKTTDPGAWRFLKTTVDGSNMLFGMPLTPQQMEKLATPQTSGKTSVP